MTRTFLPFSVPQLDTAEIDEITDTIKSGWLSTGPKTKQFEEEFAKYVGVKHAIGLTSCTAALHLALLAHNISKGDEVIVPSFTFASTANMVVNVGATPIFADIEEDTYLINLADVEEKITEKTKAIIVVHYAGHPVDLDAFGKLAQKHNLVLIEDAAHAVGSAYNGKKIGSGNTCCFSFYPTKNITTGEGGMLTTNDDDVAEFVRKNRLHGMSKDAWKRYAKDNPWYYTIEYSGWKYNMFDLQAALGLHQLKKLDEFTNKRKSLVSQYTSKLSTVDAIKLPVCKENITHSYHLFPIQIIKGNRDEIISELSKRNIGTSVHFIPLHLQKFYVENYATKEGDLPITEQVFSNILSLPLYPGMSKEDANYVCEQLIEVLK